MTASSEWDVNLGRHAPNLGRLHYQANGVKQGAWIAGSNNADEWLQIDLINRNTKVTGVATQGPVEMEITHIG